MDKIPVAELLETGISSSSSSASPLASSSLPSVSNVKMSIVSLYGEDNWAYNLRHYLLTKECYMIEDNIKDHDDFHPQANALANDIAYRFVKGDRVGLAVRKSELGYIIQVEYTKESVMSSFRLIFKLDGKHPVDRTYHMKQRCHGPTIYYVWKGRIACCFDCLICV